MTAASAEPCAAWSPICPGQVAPVDPAGLVTWNAIALAATAVLWERTKRRFGPCPITYRPCREDCGTFGYWASMPAGVSARLLPLVCRSCAGTCSCTRIYELELPWPVAAVSQVKVDGVVLAPAKYRVDDHRWLVRLDGNDWPACNDLNLADTAAGTWSVTATYGEAVPELGRLAVGQLMTEMLKQCNGDSTCALPMSTVERITRQGVTKGFFDADKAFARGKIGLFYCDLFIDTYNPNHTGVASIYDIDEARSRRRVVGT